MEVRDLAKFGLWGGGTGTFLYALAQAFRALFSTAEAKVTVDVLGIVIVLAVIAGLVLAMLGLFGIRQPKDEDLIIAGIAIAVIGVAAFIVYHLLLAFKAVG